jgi:GT2 family glycosyltransferase
MQAGSVAERRLPLCTVVIPTRHRPQLLRKCLESIAECDYPHDRLEVLVGDDGDSVNGAVDVVKGRLEADVLSTPGLGPAAARNAASRHASGTVLAFTDDDCRVDPGWLRALCSRLENAPRRAAGGHTTNSLRGNRWSAASQRIIDVVYAYYNADPDHARFLTTNNLAVPTEAFRDVGGFDESFRTAEDRDFCRRWLARGLEIAYAPDALVHHMHPLTLQAFLRQHFDYGRGAFRFHREAEHAHDGQLRAVLGFYGSMPRLLRELDDNGRGGLADVALWQAANAAGFVWEAARSVARRAG